MTPKQKLSIWVGTAGVATLGAFVQVNEGTVLHAYRDPVGILTACTGETHYVTQQGDITPGSTYTPDQCADALLRSIWAHAEPVIRCTENKPLTVGQKIAFADFNYNTGLFCQSSIARKAAAGDVRGSCDAILLYRFAGGKDCSTAQGKHTCGGVWTRRLKEHEVCLTP